MLPDMGTWFCEAKGSEKYEKVLTKTIVDRTPASDRVRQRVLAEHDKYYVDDKTPGKFMHDPGSKHLCIIVIS